MFLEDYITNYINITEKLLNHIESDNPTFKQAMTGKYVKEWKDAIQTELQTLKELNTFTKVNRSSVDKKFQIIPTKFVLRIKRKTKELIDKFKARLVVLGNLEKKDSITDLFAPTANEKSFKLLFALAAKLKLILQTLDIYAAFLNPDIDKETYVSLPKSYTNGIDVVWRLNKALYGLSISPRLFYKHISKLLLSYDYKVSNADPCFFIKSNHGEIILIVIHVDDMAIASNSQNLINQLHLQLSK
mmetsp:Transcript_10348/g.9271  ORF Transcript_10348/g.9271 Transcript_10348/m.9271 type:complete len:245 (+) Transcript_10348:1470-2204(+)